MSLGSNGSGRAAIRIRAIALIAAVALVSLSAYVLRTAGPPPAAAPTTPVGSTATPRAAASASPTAAPADRYGYVFTTATALGSVFNGDQPIVVRRERDATPAFELAGVLPAVSIDGQRLAYWRTTPNVGATELRVLDVADPRTDRSVLSLDAQTLGGAAIWSNDGAGLLISTFSREVSGGGVDHCPLRSELVMVDLATAPVTTRSAGSGGCTLVPLAWDRPGQVAAAIVTGPGGYATEYMTWNGNAANPFARTNVPREAGTAGVDTSLFAFGARASDDAKLVLGFELNLNVLRVWPILDITRADQVRRPARNGFAIWRPGTGATAAYEVIWGVGPKLNLFRYRTDSSTTLYTSTADTTPLAVRPDGSGVLVAEVSAPTAGSPLPATRLVVVEIATRQATEVAALASGTPHVLTRGVLLP